MGLVLEVTGMSVVSCFKRSLRESYIAVCLGRGSHLCLVDHFFLQTFTLQWAILSDSAVAQPLWFVVGGRLLDYLLIMGGYDLPHIWKRAVRDLDGFPVEQFLQGVARVEVRVKEQQKLPSDVVSYEVGKWWREPDRFPSSVVVLLPRCFCEL